MNQSIKKVLPKLLNVVLIISLAIALSGFWTDVQNTLQHGGIDLRNRVVGARVLVRGMDPYHFHWNPDFDEQLLDPMVEPGATTTRVTVPPSVLLIHAPFANIPYFYQQMGWLMVQWAAFIGTLAFIVRTKANPLKRKLLIGVGLLLISTNTFWRMHVERGQIYIVYGFLLALAYGILSDRRANHPTFDKTIVSGSMIGLAAALRFPILVMVVPMIYYRKFKLLAATSVSFLLFLIGSIGLTGIDSWKHYISALGVFEHVSYASNLGQTTNIVLPKTIEGMTNLSSYALFDTGNFSVQKIVHSFSGISLKSSTLILLICAALIAYVFLVHILKLRTSAAASIAPLDTVFLMGTLMILIVDFFIPAPRFSYNNVQILIPLLLIFKNLTALNSAIAIPTILLSVSLFFNTKWFDWLPYHGLIGEYLPVGLMIWISLSLMTGTVIRNSVQTRQLLKS